PELESFDAITDTVARSQKDHRRLDTGFTQLFYQRPTILLREHNVYNEEVELAIAGRAQSSGTIAGDVDAEPSFTKAFGQKRSGLFFVFNNENPHRFNL